MNNEWFDDWMNDQMKELVIELVGAGFCMKEPRILWFKHLRDGQTDKQTDEDMRMRGRI